MDSLDAIHPEGVQVGLVVGAHEQLVGPDVWDDRIGRVELRVDDAERIPETAVDAWCVIGADQRVRRLVGRHGAPALFVMDPGQVQEAARLVRGGLHDVAWLPSSPEEVNLRLHGVLARRFVWNEMASMVVREISHDFRSPLQALALVLQAMERSQGQPVQPEDLERLSRVLDTCELLATATSNMGHWPTRRWIPWGEAPSVVDLGAVVTAVSRSVTFQGRVDLELEAGLSVLAAPKLLQRAMSDVLYLTYRRLPRRQRISVLGAVMGDEVVLRVRAPSYPAFLEHLGGLMHREDCVIAHRARKPVPFSGLAFAREVVLASGGSLTADREDDALAVDLRMPRATAA